MQPVTIHAAQTDLPRLIEAALAGEDVVISRDATPVVRLVPVARQPFRICLLAGRLGTMPDLLSPLDPDGLAAWEGGP